MVSNGIRSWAALARRAKVHRNTLGRFCWGREPVLPGSVARILDELQLTPGVAIERGSSKKDLEAERTLAWISDKLVEANPFAAYILFGSRARGEGQRYSDFDIGVFSKNGLELDKYLSLIDVKEQCEEETPWFVDLVNLNNADSAFLSGIAPDVQFLGGRQGDWLALKERLGDGYRKT